MIAAGTTVLFTDKIGSPFSPSHKEPHDGQAGTVTNYEDPVYLVKFPDGKSVWADPDEVTAL